MDVYLSSGLEQKSAQDRGRRGAGARRGRLAGTAFPDADVDILTIANGDEYDIGPFGKHRVALQLAAHLPPVDIKAVHKNSRHGIADIHRRERVLAARESDGLIDDSLAFAVEVDRNVATRESWLTDLRLE